MNPTFTQALRYFAEVKCLSPLKTGGANEQILRRMDGTPILQGASLTGALRGWKENAGLFGGSDAESAVTVSDLTFRRTDETVKRSRVSINSSTGTGDNFFFIDALPTGTIGDFQIVWRGKDGMEAAADSIEEYLSALNLGMIALGGQKTNGFGRVQLITVKKRAYRMDRKDDLEAWLDGDEVRDAQEIQLAKNLTNGEVSFEIQAETDNLLVKSFLSEGVGEKGIKAVPIEENNKIVIPGSAIKGVIRAHIGRIVPYLYPEKGADAVDRLFGRGSDKGDNGLAGKIRFSDGTVEESATAVTPRIRINRFSGGTVDGSLFKERTAGGRLEFSIRVPGEEKAGCLLLLFALRDLELGMYELGSGSSIGRGRFGSVQVAITVGNSHAVMVCENDTVTVEDSDGLIASWQNEAGGAAK